MRKDLTDALLRTLKPPASGRLELRDARAAGLIFRSQPRGLPPGQCEPGPTRASRHAPPSEHGPAWALPRPVKQAMGIIAAIQAGGDPVTEKRTAKAAKAARAARGRWADRLAEWQGSREKDKVDPWSARYASDVRRVCDQAVVPALGKAASEGDHPRGLDQVLRSRQKSGPGAAVFL
jgi:hypothetical protein